MLNQLLAVRAGLHGLGAQLDLLIESEAKRVNGTEKTICRHPSGARETITMMGDTHERYRCRECRAEWAEPDEQERRDERLLNAGR
jgi:hypothetical protein